jgi:hypothetical protein
LSMVTRILKILFVGLLLSASACYRISYKFTLDPGKTFSNSYWNNYFIYGLAPVKESYSQDDLCGYGAVSRLDTKISGANMLSSIFSLGLTGANTLSVQCIQKSPVPEKIPDKGKAAGVAKLPGKL